MVSLLVGLGVVVVCLGVVFGVYSVVADARNDADDDLDDMYNGGM